MNSKYSFFLIVLAVLGLGGSIHAQQKAPLLLHPKTTPGPPLSKQPLRKPNYPPKNVN